MDEQGAQWDDDPDEAEARTAMTQHAIYQNAWFWLMIMVAVIVVVSVVFAKSHAGEGVGRVCKNCGASHPGFARFCRRCGQRLIG